MNIPLWSQELIVMLIDKIIFNCNIVYRIFKYLFIKTNIHLCVSI